MLNSRMYKAGMGSRAKQIGHLMKDIQNKYDAAVLNG